MPRLLMICVTSSSGVASALRTRAASAGGAAHIKRGELAVQQGREEEVPVPPAEPGGVQVVTHVQERQPGGWPATEEHLAVGTPERRAGNHARLPSGGPLVPPSAGGGPARR